MRVYLGSGICLHPKYSPLLTSLFTHVRTVSISSELQRKHGKRITNDKSGSIGIQRLTTHIAQKIHLKTKSIPIETATGLNLIMLPNLGNEKLSMFREIYIFKDQKY